MKKNTFYEDGEYKKEEYTPLCVIAFWKERFDFL